MDDRIRNFAKQYTCLTVLCIAMIGAASLFFVFWHTNNPSISSHILSLTYPIMSVSGNVLSVGNSSFVLQVQSPSARPPVDPTRSNASPSAQSSIMYTVNILSTTRISRLDSGVAPVRADFPPTGTAPLSIKDIKVNDSVSVFATVDLRTLQKDTFDAVSVMLPSTTRTLSGVITAMQTDTFTVHGNVSSDSTNMLISPATALKDYTVVTSANTKISSFTIPTGGVPAPAPGVKAIALSDLTKDMRVTITFDSSAVSTDGKILALTIVVFNQASPNILPPSTRIP